MPSCTNTEANQQEAESLPETPVDSTSQTCGGGEEEAMASGAIRILVVVFDPLADAGLYDTWMAGVAGAVDVPAEIPASGVDCRLTMTRAGTSETRNVTVPDDTEVVLEADDLDAASMVEVSLPGLSTTGAAAAWVSAHTQGGHVEVDDGDPADEPRHRNLFRCRAGAAYTIRIWLKPKTIVLHWSVTGRNRDVNSKTGRCYNFRVIEDGGTIRWRTGASDTDPRFWRHNLRIDGVPSVPGVDGEAIQVDQNLGGSRQAYWGSTGQTAVRPAGYTRHAGGFNTNSVGVNACGMSGSTETLIGQTHAITSAQVERLVTEVKHLCDAWRLDPTDAHHLCTHFEVNHLHRNKTPPGKWDITWLPEEQQDAYESANTQLLCTRPVPAGAPTPADQPYRYRRYVDVELTGTFTRPPAAGDAHVKTDRVSEYLRDLVNGA